MNKKNASHDVPEKPRIVLTMTFEQARVVSRACELYTRLHIGQLKELNMELLSGFEKDDFCERKDRAEGLLEKLKRLYFPALAPLPGSSLSVGGAGIQTERAWDIYQVIRHAIAWHEHPEGGVTVDFHPVYPMAGESPADCEVVRR